MLLVSFATRPVQAAIGKIGWLVHVDPEGVILYEVVELNYEGLPPILMQLTLFILETIKEATDVLTFPSCFA